MVGVLSGAAALGVVLPSRQQPAAASQPAVAPEQGGPSSDKPSDQAVAGYRVPPNDPKYLAIPSLGIGKTRILKLGLRSDGDMATPNNIHDVGWYEGSARPGVQGAAFLYGHLSNWEARGVFYKLKNLNTGQKIIVTTGNDTSYTYEVVITKTYPYNKVDMPAALRPVDGSVSGLNLMTCAGRIIAGTNEFEERLVIFARLVATSASGA